MCLLNYKQHATRYRPSYHMHIIHIAFLKQGLAVIVFFQLVDLVAAYNAVTTTVMNIAYAYAYMHLFVSASSSLLEYSRFC